MKNKIQRKPSWTQNLRKYFSEYCVTCGVHGVRYLGESGRFLVEKLTWGVVVVIMCYFCITLILSAYNRWITSPVIVTFATTETPIWDIPFPAVTICPEVKSDPRIFNYSDAYLKLHSKSNITAEESRYFESLSLVCNFLDIPGYGESATIKESCIYDLNNAFPAPKFSAEWQERKSANLLSGTYTREGFCYSFNMLDTDEILRDTTEYVVNRSLKGRKAEKWSIENGYSRGAERDVFPRRTSLNGINGGFQIELPTEHYQLDYFCSGFLEGFKVVTIHHPSELPNMKQHFTVPLDQIVSVKIEPKLITVSEEVKAYEPKKRGCLFPNERQLMLFRSYSQHNCLDECFANCTLKECGCVAFYMPKIHKTPMCGPGRSLCLANCEVKYLSTQTDRNTIKNHNVANCNCLPSCTSLTYEMELSQSNLKLREGSKQFFAMGEAPTNESNHEDNHFSVLSAYFGNMQFLATERNELYGIVDFFANAGGLLGLFIGFSVTSAVEIIYFLTLRIVCNIRKFGRAKWAGVQDLEK